MRYSIAAVAVASLATSALGAAHGHAGHHQHHAREAEPAAEADPEPTNYTYSDGQCWGAYGCNSKTGAPPASTQPAATTTAAAYSAPAQTSAQVTAAAAASSSSNGGGLGGIVSQVTSAAASVASGAAVDVESILGSCTGDKIASVVSDGTCVEGTGNPNVFEITNKLDEPVVYLAWGPMGQWVNSKSPVGAFGLAPGESKTISWADTPQGSQGGGGYVIRKGSTLVNGQVSDTSVEHTFNTYGTVDVSREINMNGQTPISISFSNGCTSSMTSCVFQCLSGNTCGDPDTYHLVNCSGPGSNPGKPDAAGNIVDGGCLMGSGKATMTIG